MPIAPKIPFHKVTCTACGWSHVSVQRSDVILAPRVCGKCGGAKLTHSTPNLLEAMATDPMALLKKGLLGR